MTPQKDLRALIEETDALHSEISGLWHETVRINREQLLRILDFVKAALLVPPLSPAGEEDIELEAAISRLVPMLPVRNNRGILGDIVTNQSHPFLQVSAKFHRAIEPRADGRNTGGDANDLVLILNQVPHLFMRLRKAISSLSISGKDETLYHGLDSEKQVLFYEQDFYVLSNFSSFTLHRYSTVFPTSEHAYHWEKFANWPAAMCRRANDLIDISDQICRAPSAHEAFKIAERNKGLRRPDWDDVKVGIMRDILRAKVAQHEYVRRKLLATGDRELIENSWRDDYWGWGPNKDGQNMLGKLWMEVRAELRAAEKAT